MSGADNVVWLGTPPFPEAARAALADTRLRANLSRATGTIRDRRLAVTAELDDWEELRETAAAVKRRTLRHLDRHLLRLEETVTAAGGTVHWAADASEANAIVTRLVQATVESEIVKVKSMATQEIGLNEALAESGIRAYETDLAELIVQLGGDRPSHILVPAIHRGRSEIREIFQRQMGKWGRPAPEGLTDDPRDLAEAARLHLREKFLRAKVAVSGANFAAADTGTVVVVESEGNGRMCLTLPETLITVMGVEKVLPSFSDLDVFLQLLPRSSTGERMNPYTSLWTGVTEGDGPQDFHLVLLDNGRTATLADEVGRQALSCIRCSACLNVCPVYERTGGHAYGSVYPGPIGAVLTPQLVGVENAASLPFASTLCGACYDACPVKIDIPEVLVHLRAKAVEAKRRDRLLPTTEALAMKAAGVVLSSPRRLAAIQRLAALGARLVARDGRIGFLPGPFARWSGTRDTPTPARESLRAWWRRTRGENRMTTEGKGR
ncbi:L-lactate dehydrogenase complex protein LldF [Streptomyces sp. cf124]|uniref:LutB/LldF family L-lactate oxidation iron-sulfur protein n=1 Tax=Streptomyces sp. cf124 TaxID=1761903 RepID=UPI0008EF8A8C|nr:LutB/LldF family L-lactate oxidation iron-sulfur protein [Streptomyces sp. cf124]SFO09580.1 L-lactate dehydrogenase complex protein LldF [Streptomyces sp. cf124]